MNARVLVILGMHRSCTSLVSQWLQKCGLAIGNNLVPGNIGNLQGHFEDAEFLELHKLFLKNRNLPWTGLVNEPVSALSDNEKQQLESLVYMKNKQLTEWGWKDPRTCLFLSDYYKALPDAYYLVVIRGFNETVNSLITREFKLHIQRFNQKKGLSKLKWILYKKKDKEYFYKKMAEGFLKTWIHYYTEIIEHLRILPLTKFIVVHYSYLLRYDKKVFSHIQDEWLFSLDHVPFQKVYTRELISLIRDITPYIKNQQLLEKAIQLEKIIEDYFTITTTESYRKIL